jgi:hypothetical protein
MNTSSYKLGYQAAQAQASPSCPKGVDKKEWERGYKLGLIVAKKKAA